MKIARGDGSRSVHHQAETEHFAGCVRLRAGVHDKLNFTLYFESDSERVAFALDLLGQMTPYGLALHQQRINKLLKIIDIASGESPCQKATPDTE